MDLRGPPSPSDGPVAIFTYDGVDYSLFATPSLRASDSVSPAGDNLSMYTSTFMTCETGDGTHVIAREPSVPLGVMRDAFYGSDCSSTSDSMPGLEATSDSDHSSVRSTSSHSSFPCEIYACVCPQQTGDVRPSPPIVPLRHGDSHDVLLDIRSSPLKTHIHELALLRTSNASSSFHFHYQLPLARIF